MYAVRMSQHGGPEVLKYEEVPTPEPGPGQARVKIAAAGVNFMDVYGRMGQGSYKGQLPTILGSEAAGTVDAVGPGVTEVVTGEDVAYTGLPGAYAEYAIVSAERLVRVPVDLDLNTAAAVMLQGMTAHYLAHDTYPLHLDEVALVYAAAGGTGGLLTQIAKMRGARVLAAVGSDEKAAIARELGADETVQYEREDVAQAARRLTNGRGVDVVYDSVGKDAFEKSLDSLRKRGYWVLFGQSSGPVPPIDPQVLNAKGSLFLTRPTLVHYIETRDELLRRADDLFNWIIRGELKVRIDRTFPLSQAAEAHKYLESRQSKGKILLIPGQ